MIDFERKMHVPQNRPFAHFASMGLCTFAFALLTACGGGVGVAPMSTVASLSSGGNSLSMIGGSDTAAFTPRFGDVNSGTKAKIDDSPSRKQILAGSPSSNGMDRSLAKESPTDTQGKTTSVPGSVSACSSTPVVTAAGSLNLSVAASRASGVAPLSVFFDATGTTSSTTARPFHDIEYRWNFGETSGPGVGTWSQGARPGLNSRNAAIGPVAGHVFETPGVYTVTVADVARTVSYQCQITVQDPDVVFAGAKTACFSTSGKFDACPTGAAHITTSDFQAVTKSATATNSVRRLLMRRGETWKVDSTASITSQGPGLIGAFGAGPRPVIQTAVGFSQVAPALAFSSYLTKSMKDWRIMDVVIDGSANAGTHVYGIGGMGGIDQFTILRVGANALRIGIVLDSELLDSHNRSSDPRVYGHHVWDQLAIVDTDVTNIPHSTTDHTTGGIGYYFSGERVFFAGNFADCEGTSVANVSHVARFTYLGKAAISNNTLNRAGPSQHSIKLHGPNWGSNTTLANGIGGGYTRWVVISDNEFVGANGAWLVTVGSQDHGHDQRVKDVILERNSSKAGPGTQYHQGIWAYDITSRNNVFDMTGAPIHGGILLSKSGLPSMPNPDGIKIYHNTFYSPDIDNSFLAIRVEVWPTNLDIRNNLAYAPNDSQHWMIQGVTTPSVPTTLENNSTATQTKSTSPLFVGPFTSLTGFAVSSGSYAKGAGAPLPVWSDFFGDARSATAPTMGAVE